MTVDRLFDIANLVAMIGWLALLAAPLRRPFSIVFARVVGVVLAVTYAVLLGRSLLAVGAGDVDFTTLAGVTSLFARPEAVLVGWVHYLAFDLWVGSWAVEDAGRRELTHWAVAPCLVFIFLAGPLGLLLYLAARAALARDKAFA